MAEQVYLVVHAGYDIYDIKGIYRSEKAAEAALKKAGLRVYKTGDRRGQWSKRSMWHGLYIHDYEMGGEIIDA